MDELRDTMFSKSFKPPSAWAEREVKYKMEKKDWEEKNKVFLCIDARWHEYLSSIIIEYCAEGMVTRNVTYGRQNRLQLGQGALKENRRNGKCRL